MKIFNLKPKTYKLKPSRGFTLIETLVAISILMVAVASPLTISQKGLASAIYAKDQIIASYLAQDAIEYLRNVSDKNVALGVNWLSGVGGGIDIQGQCASSCKVDTLGGANSISACSGETCRLLYDEPDHIYSYTSGSNSLFTRSVTVTEPVADEALIKVNISWMSKNTPRSLDFYTRIYNWRKL